ncbi:dentin sialophosphoprotein-like protein [Rhynchospora pubera]|uniref:Dentin sialophosphoprotein-like protein n=1 Tax=Rhynchospora pubera TaxID=906938 RepID=A0AAV8HW49_9POAL|nr:dentin sialophosphoprotein-like protein [Rhynchospora pubera]
MYKPGRGGGGGRRPTMTAAPPRPGGSMGRGPISAASRGRGRGRGGPSTSASAPPARDETFSLESGGAPDFASIIRLIPDLVDEIRRCEAQGGTARIKFGSNSLNPSENVIEVGLKEYNFTWSPELGVCDIYEVSRNGEDGNGLLIERGSALRKMNVQRILDESAKNQVKMRSVQAELQSKSRKSIILDPANPSVQKQVKSMAAAGVEGSMRRWGPKEKFFKKSNPAPVSAPPKTITKVGPPSSNFPKNATSVSPPSPPQHSFRGSSMDLNVETIKEEIAPQNLYKDEKKKFEKGTAVGSGNGLKACNVSENSADLRGLLINVLSENPKGLSIKDLEKAVGNSFSDSAKRIESVVKTIATSQASGRYILKSGFVPEGSKWHASDRSSPDSTPEFHDEIDKALHVEENNTLNKEDNIQYNLEEEPMDVERIDIEGGSPLVINLNIDINIHSNESEGKASSSSDSSDSDSDSASSDNSGSRSPSHSPAGSRSESSSQSDSSSSSDDDVEVNITSDDEKQTHQTNGIIGADLNLSPSSERANGQNSFTRVDPSPVNITTSPLINLNDDMHATPVTVSGTGVDHRPSEEENLDQFVGGSDGKIKRPAVRNDFMEKRLSLGERRPGPSLNSKHNSNLKRPSGDRLPDAKRFKTAPSPNLPVEVIPGESKGGTIPQSSPNLPDGSADWDININLDSGHVSTSKQQNSAKNTARKPGNNRSISNERFSDEKLVQKRTRGLTNVEANGSAPLAKKLRENSAVLQRCETNDEKSPAPAKKVLRREMSELELGEFREPDDELRRLFGSSSSSKPEDDDEEEDINIENKTNNANNSVNSNKMVGYDNLRGRNVSSASPLNLTMRPQQRATIYSCSNNNLEAISDIDRVKSGRAHRSEEDDGNRKKDRNSGAHSSRNTSVSQVRPPASQLESNNKQDGDVNGAGPVKKLSKVSVNGELSRNKGPSSCDDSLYLRYNKDQPDLKGPISDILQFEEYIKEYQEKYPVYISLNKEFEEYRERYIKMGEEMDAAKGKGTGQYASIVEKMREMFRRDKDRHCLLKKIFLILHEELGTIKEKLRDFYEGYNQNLD